MRNTIYWPVKLWVVVLLVLFMAAACRAPETTDQVATANMVISATRTPNVDLQEGGVVSFTVDDLHISMERPSNWQHYVTDYGVVIAEALGSVAGDGRLGGLLTHVFVPPLENVELPVSQAGDHNTAWRILDQITHKPDYIGSALVSEPVAFEWGGNEAAYYLVGNNEGTLTIVIGLIVAETGQLVACSISAPVDQAHRIRESLGDLLHNLTVNAAILNGQELEEILPDVLHFPQRELPVE